MDWHLAIEKNREALKGILMMLIAMAGLSVSGAAGSAGIFGERPDPSPTDAPKTLPRHLHRFVLRLLRPAEAAVRRLIIVAARGLVVEVLPPRIRKPQPKPLRNRRNGFGTGIVIRPGPLPEWARKLAPKRSASLSLPLFDPLKRFGVRRNYVKPSAVPRIWSFDDMRVPLFQQPRQPNALPPSPDDPLDAGRLARRIEAIGRALDDLPRQAKRLARWQARRDTAAADLPPSCGGDVRPLRQAQDRGGREGAHGDAIVYAAATPTKLCTQRVSPMRPGRPPGWQRRPDHPVYQVLTELHGLAVWARERPDTS